MTNENGFTLTEMMLSLMILMAIVSFFPLFMSFFELEDNRQLRSKEVELFFMQISDEIHGAKQLSVDKSNERVDITLKNGNVASYERYGTNIRRRINKTGHQVLLQNIDGVTFSLSGDKLLYIEITGKNGESFVRKKAVQGEYREE